MNEFLSRLFLAPTLLVALSSWLGTYPKKIDWANVPAYQRGLLLSTSPRAAAIRRHIANGPADLAREEAAARDEGIPVSTSDLHLPDPPSGQNAADDYRAIQKLPGLPGTPAARIGDLVNKWHDRRTLSASERDELRRLLADSPALKLAHVAVAKEHCIPYRTYDPKSVEHILGQNNAVRVLSAESLSLAFDGKPDVAAQNQFAAFTVVRHACEYPTLFNALTGMSCERAVLQGFGDILQAVGPNPRVASDVTQILQLPRYRPDLSTALRGEAALTMDIYGSMKNDSPDELHEHMDPAYGLGLSDEEEQTSDIPLPQLPPPERFTSGEKAFVSDILDAFSAAELHELRRRIRAADGPDHILHYPDPTTAETESDDPIVRDVATGMTFSPRRLRQNQLRNEALQKCLLAGAALLAYRSSHSAFPAVLETALPHPPIDPFSGKPLGYRREGTGFVVYSIGADRTFTGGAPDQKRKYLDVLFRYPEPPKPADKPLWLPFPPMRSKRFGE